MHYPRVIAAAILNQILLLGCGGPDQSSIIRSRPADSQIVRNFYLPTSLMAKQLQCRSLQECPSNVGLVLTAKTNPTLGSQFTEVSRCTGFLVSEDIVATNSHCVPDWLKKDPGADCSEGLGIRFRGLPETNSFVCKEILKFSQVTPEVSSTILYTPDYAFFRVEKTGKRSFPFSRSDLSDDQIVKIPTFDEHPAQNDPDFLELVVKRCPVVFKSFALDVGENPLAPILLLGDCGTQKGNSGSPVLNDSNEVVGLFYGRATFAEEAVERLISELSDRFYRLHLTDLGLNRDFSLVTNSSCLSLDGVLKPRAECSSITTGTGPQQAEPNPAIPRADFRDPMRRHLEAWTLKIPSNLHYQLSHTEEDGTYTFGIDPICIKATAEREQIARFPGLIWLTTGHLVDPQFRIVPSVWQTSETLIEFTITAAPNGAWNLKPDGIHPGDTATKQITLPPCEENRAFSRESAIEDFLNSIQ